MGHDKCSCCGLRKCSKSIILYKVPDDARILDALNGHFIRKGHRPAFVAGDRICNQHFLQSGGKPPKRKRNCEDWLSGPHALDFTMGASNYTSAAAIVEARSERRVRRSSGSSNALSRSVSSASSAAIEDALSVSSESVKHDRKRKRSDAAGIEHGGFTDSTRIDRKKFRTIMKELNEARDENLAFSREIARLQREMVELKNVAYVYSHDWFEANKNRYQECLGLSSDDAHGLIDEYKRRKGEANLNRSASQAEFSPEDKVMVSLSYITEIPNFATLSRLCEVFSPVSLARVVEDVFTEFADIFKHEISFPDVNEWRETSRNFMHEENWDHKLKNFVKDKAVMIVDGVGLLEYKNSNDSAIANSQYCHFKHAYQSRIQIVIGPDCRVLHIGPLDIGKQDDHTAFNKCGFNSAFRQYLQRDEVRQQLPTYAGATIEISIRETTLDKAANERTVERGTGVWFLMLGDQGYPNADTGGLFDLLLTRSAEDNGEWSKAKNKADVIPHPKISSKRSLVERVFGYIKGRYAYLSSPYYYSQKKLTENILQFVFGLMNRRIAECKLKF